MMMMTKKKKREKEEKFRNKLIHSVRRECFFCGNTDQLQEDKLGDKEGIGWRQSRIVMMQRDDKE